MGTETVSARAACRPTEGSQPGIAGHLCGPRKQSLGSVWSSATASAKRSLGSPPEPGARSFREESGRAGGHAEHNLVI